MRQMRILVLLVLSGLALVGSGCKNLQPTLDACQNDLSNMQGLYERTQTALNQCIGERDMYRRQLADAQTELSSSQTVKETGLEAFGGTLDAEKGTITVPLASDVLFDSGKAELKDGSKSRLNEIAGIIKSLYNDKEIDVIGHTDSDPIKISGWEDNWELSSMRSLAVTRYLLTQGISAQQLAAVGRSEYHPLTQNKADNRRVEIVVKLY